MAVITFTTDFGHSDSYVAQMKGAALRVNPRAALVDVVHSVGHQDVAHGARVINEIVDLFPPATVHVVVVDPGVGSPRALILARLAGQFILAPDNGLFTRVARRHPPDLVRVLTERRYWRDAVSRTFHGRDILAPVAAHLTLGVDPAQFGPEHESRLIELVEPQPVMRDGAARGEIVAVDSFGNLITNLSARDLPAPHEELDVVIKDRRLHGIRGYYGEVGPGQLLSLMGSSGALEIAVNRGSAASDLGAGVGAAVWVVARASPTDGT